MVQIARLDRNLDKEELYVKIIPLKKSVEGQTKMIYIVIHDLLLMVISCY